MSRTGEAKESSTWLARLFLQFSHALHEGFGDVLPGIRPYDAAHILHTRLLHRLQERDEVQQLRVVCLQLPRLELSPEIATPDRQGCCKRALLALQGNWL